jgi:hypothetical protein
VAPIVELLIGLIFLYLVLSLLASAVNEGIAGIFALRAVYLERGIASLLGRGLTAKFFEHNLIRSLTNEGRLLKQRKPSYISAGTFTDTLVDLLRKAQRPGSAPAVSDNVAALSPSAPGEEVLAEVRTKLQAAELQDANYPVLRNVLELFSREATSLIDFRKMIEGWYDETMQRVSGWYKRFTRLIMFGFGLALVIVINADTLNVANTLWRDSSIRSAVSDQAAAFVQQGKLTTDQAQQQLAALEGLKLPLGWKFHAESTDARRIPVDFAEVLTKLLGILMTAIALTFGAPFWFDLLKKFVGLRSSGGEPQPAQTGPPSGAPAEVKG